MTLTCFAFGCDPQPRHSGAYVCRHCGDVTVGWRAAEHAATPSLTIGVCAALSASITVAGIAIAVRWALT